MTDWALTLPQNIEWADYKLELDAAEKGAVLNYRVHYHANVLDQDRVFIVWRGQVCGFHFALGCFRKPAWTCTTTGVEWPAGYYVQRTGKFHPMPGGFIAMKGFRGIRKVNFSDCVPAPRPVSAASDSI